MYLYTFVFVAMYFAFNIILYNFIGIYYTMAVIGPAVGYVVGGQLLLLYTDFVTVDPIM